MGEAGSDGPYWSQDASALATALGSGHEGLTSDQAAVQLGLVGPNSVEDAPRLGAFRLLLRQFESPLVLILAVAQHLFFTKGALSNVLDICSSLDRDGVEVPLDEGRLAELEAIFEAKGTDGSRVLAVATRKVAAKRDYRDDEREMTFRGFFIFYDPPQTDAKARSMTSMGLASASR